VKAVKDEQLLASGPPTNGVRPPVLLHTRRRSYGMGSPGLTPNGIAPSAGPNGWSAPNFIELSRQRIAVAAQIGLYNMMAKAQRARNARRRGVASALACLDPNIAELSSLVSLHHVASRDSSD
jgi:hypothetical protein